MRDKDDASSPPKMPRISLDNLAETVTRERCTHLYSLSWRSPFRIGPLSRRLSVLRRTGPAYGPLIQDSTYTDVYFTYGTRRKYIVKKRGAHSARSSNSCWKNSENFHRERTSGGPVYLPAASNTFDSETLLGLFSSNVYSRSSG